MNSSNAPINRLLERDANWQPLGPPTEPTDDGIPYATHSGELHILGKTLRCYILSTGERIFNEEDFLNFFNSFGGEE